jgi:transposase
MVADVVDAVVGGDTHADTHTLEMVAAPSGATIATLMVENTERGFAKAQAWLGKHAPGPRIVVGLEGTRSYGVGLARALQRADIRVVEVARPKREQRRGRGKSDPIDAHLAALAVLRMGAERMSTPRADGDREALRILLTARREMTGTRTRQINQLRALLRGGDDRDRAQASTSITDDARTAVARRRGPSDETREQAVRREQARRLALAIRTAGAELRTNRKQLIDIVDQLAPGLLQRPGIGPVSAAQAIVSWSHAGRCRNDAAFASLAGASPIPASSGKTTRHRISRAGDRQLNRALHDIAATRWRTDTRTQQYIAKRRHSGKSDREIRRILKRYIARELYRALNAAAAA